MKFLKLAGNNLERYPKETSQILRAGGIVLYPTDTLYALWVDAFSDVALKKLFAIKNRDAGKPVSALFADIEMAERYADIDERALTLAKAFLPGPLTLILKKKPGIETGVGRGFDTIGVRIPNHPFCLALVKEFGKPITATSANKSGEEIKSSVEEILEQLGAAAKSLDLVIDAGVLAENKPSTVVDISIPKPRILREGAIPTDQIQKVLSNL